MLKLMVAASVYLMYAIAGEDIPLDQVRYQANTVSRQVVLVAHQDDWQLFMGDVIAGRIAAGDSVTFVYVTAGDNGRDSSYWLTRERAALQSTLVAIGQTAAGHSSVQCAMSQVLSHSLRKCTVGKTESYFLRLPDGRRNGAGFARHQYQSLRKLRSNEITAITAIDGSATYAGWNDLARTVSSLIGSETVAFPITVHATDPSKAINPHDHFDHRIVGLIVYDLRKSHSFGTKFYVGYAVATRAANRTTDQARTKEQLFLAYDQQMMLTNTTWSAYAEHPAFYSQCIVRTYARTVGTGAHP